MKTDFEFLTTEIDGHILTVTINRPEVMNALHPPAHSEFDEVWNEFDKDEDLWGRNSNRSRRQSIFCRK